ncbi:MAG: TatD family hydrolase [Myxococcales bacterium]|nr:TatD family hydrolase [Myxococcales bacterium]MCB9708234.1 TatD family hydrolase [Myxococcales bacterium]
MSTAPLFDSHCHLDFEDFGADLDAVLARARAANLQHLTTIGAGKGAHDANNAVALAHAHPGWIYATVGVHPHHTAELNDELFDAIGTLATDPRVVGIGETGLDYHYAHSPRLAQQHAFRRFIALARALEKPIIVHTRAAAKDTLAILKQEHASDVGGVIHCFSEDTPFAKAALDLGFVASFSGIATFPKKSEAVQEAARLQPKDAILIETDAPFLAPVPLRGKRNEPAFLVHTAAKLAELRDEDYTAFCEQTTLNARRLYRLA